MRRLRVLRRPAGLLACLCVLLSFAAPAAAHSPLEEATPAPGSKVGTGTKVISLTFPGLAHGSRPKVKLTDAQGASVPVGKPVVAGDSVVCAAVSPLHAGVTTLTYRVVAADGFHQTSSFQFEVAEGARAATAPDACKKRNLAEPVPDPGSDKGDTILGIDRTPALVGLTAVSVLVVGAVTLAVRRSRSA